MSEDELLKIRFPDLLKFHLPNTLYRHYVLSSVCFAAAAVHQSTSRRILF